MRLLRCAVLLITTKSFFKMYSNIFNLSDCHFGEKKLSRKIALLRPPAVPHHRSSASDDKPEESDRGATSYCRTVLSARFDNLS